MAGLRSAGHGVRFGLSIDSSYPGTPLKTRVTYDRQKQTELIDGLIAFHASVVFQK
jgi:hypothetical protein